MTRWTGEQLEIVSDAGIPEMAEFFVSNFWEEDVAPSQVNANMLPGML